MTQSLKLCTGGQRCEPFVFREALYCQVHHSRMRLDEIARHLGITASALADAVNPNGDGSILSAKHYDRLLELTPDNLALASFCARLGNAVVYALPTGSIDESTAKVVCEFGEMLTAHAQARGDKVVTRLEAAALRKEAEEAISAILALVEAAEREAVLSK